MSAQNILFAIQTVTYISWACKLYPHNAHNVYVYIKYEAVLIDNLFIYAVRCIIVPAILQLLHRTPLSSIVDNFKLSEMYRINFFTLFFLGDSVDFGKSFDPRRSLVH